MKLACPAMMYHRGILSHSYGIPNISKNEYVPKIIGNWNKFRNSKLHSQFEANNNENNNNNL